MNPNLLNRREALARLGLLLGGAIVGGEAFLRGTPVAAATPGSAAGFSAADRGLMEEIGDTIIPTTNTPGAKAAGIGAFMVMMVAEYYDEANRRIFLAGLGQIEAECQARHDQPFAACTTAQRTALLNALDAAQRAQSKADPQGPPHYFQLMKQLTLLGYFTSEIGASQALRYVEVPGAFRGNEPYRKGDRAWYVQPRG